MKNAKRILILVLVIALGAFTANATAQAGGIYELTWSTIDGGGATFSTGGVYELGGTIGQPDAGNHTGGNYALAGGFWGAFTNGATMPSKIFLPFIIK